MEEQQALLGRTTVRPSLFSPTLGEAHVGSRGYAEEQYDEGNASSSDGSDSWWDDSNSSCSSCSQSSDEEWADEITPNGELLYIEAAPLEPKSDVAGKVDGVLDETDVEGVLPVSNKPGKFVRWIRRRESKRQRPRLSVVGDNNESTSPATRGGLLLVTVQLQGLHVEKADLAQLGIVAATGHGNAIIIADVLPDGPLAGNDKVSTGDCLKTLNGEEVTLSNLGKRLSGLSSTNKVTLGFIKRKEHANGREKSQSKLVERLLEGDPSILAKLSKLPAGLLAINTGEQIGDAPDSDLVFSFPPQSCLATARGAFTTLAHLIPSVVGSEVRSCTCAVKGQDVHVAFIKEEDLLVLVALPEKVCRVEEISWISNDVIRCLQFSHQTLHLCFQKDVDTLHKFLSSFFARLLSVGNSGILDVPLEAVETMQHHFHEYLPAAPWIPLPREAQLQLDDALNELEACDFGHSGEDAQESERLYVILGSCLYHGGYLLVSHLAKDDLLDVHCFLRQNGLLELTKDEGVSRMIIWREVYPSSVNRGLPPIMPSAYPPPVGRWFLLIVASGQDMLCVMLENAGCCLPLARPSRPHPPHVLEAEDTLAHIQSLGLTSLAAQWLSSQARPRTTTHSYQPSAKEKAWSPLQRSSGGSKAAEVEKNEDSTSQTTSNVSNTSNASESDENAPILGRRAERSAQLHTTLREVSDESQSESEDSDSDWGSFKGLSIHDNGSGLFDNPYMPSNVDDLDDITPSKITTGPDNQLFHFVHIDGNEGVVVTPAGVSAPPDQLMSLFTRAAHNIHAQLQHNVRFRATADPRGVVNKSLIAVKECAVLLDAVDNSGPHWVVGRLFFTPWPREVYVCFSDSAPQNMLELAFRLCLGVAG